MMGGTSSASSLAEVNLKSHLGQLMLSKVQSESSKIELFFSCPMKSNNSKVWDENKHIWEMLAQIWHTHC